MNITEQTNVETFNLIAKCCDRAEKEIVFHAGAYDRFSSFMDLELAVNLLDLDLERMLAADILNFGHDFVGVMTNINRQTKSFDNCWAPRHTK